MSQQHAQGYGAATRVVASKFGDDGGHGRFEVEQSTLVEDHGHRCGGDGLGDGRQVENAGRRDGRRRGIVGEVAEGVEGN